MPKKKKEELKKEAIGLQEITEAFVTLQKYKANKAVFEERTLQEEQAWKLHDRVNVSNPKLTTKASAWTFNSIMNKHADLMDSAPTATLLPREQSDEEEAKTLSQIVPVIMERSEFDKQYSKGSWYKLKHGASAYGVFWDNSIDNGLGDIVVRHIDMLNVYWESGIENIQDSQNIFIVNSVDTDTLKSMYPEKDIKSSVDTTTRYYTDDTVDTSNQSMVVDWYYKVKKGTKTVLHYCKFVGDCVLYASENDPQLKDVGWYEHGKYPIVFDVLYPLSGTPYGMGLIELAKNTQTYIDDLDTALMDNAKKMSKARWFVKNNGGIAEDEYADWDKEIVHVEGSVNDDNVKQISLSSIPTFIYNLRQSKIDELKEITANRDVSNGGTTGGVTSGAAIAVLQEAGNKVSRDIISTSYTAYAQIIRLVLELIRQFYTEDRSFRIIAPNGVGYDFVTYNNKNIQMAKNGQMVDGGYFMRKPIFDIDVKAEKKTPYSRLSQNETASNLYNMGVFNPQNAQQALIMLDMMSFDGKDDIITKIREQVEQMQTPPMMMEQAPPMSGGFESPQEDDIVAQRAEMARNYAQRLVENANASASGGQL